MSLFKSSKATHVNFFFFLWYEAKFSCHLAYGSEIFAKIIRVFFFILGQNLVILTKKEQKFKNRFFIF